MIGQNVGLKYLIPLALDLLEDDLFIDAELYEGDLLQIVINVDKGFWDSNKELRLKFDSLLDRYSDEDKEKFKKGNFQE